MKLNELHLLDKLIQHNKEENPNPEGKSLGGLSELVSSMYADKAHFVYELIQNADDVEADSIEFHLYKNYLVFIHNGKRKFSVTDPYEVIQNEKLGDLNAISWISKSVKVNEPNKIGKFGIGFYSVYKYVKEVYLKESPFFVKLHHVTLLDKISKDEEEKLKSKYNYNESEILNKTMFILPFKENEIEEAYKDIYEKLNSLNKPNIFLNHLKTIKIRFDDNDSVVLYNVTCIKKGECSIENKNYLWELICYQKPLSDTEYYYKISSILPNTKYYSSILFKKASIEGELEGQESELFCYFSLNLPIKCKFILHAPFQTTSGRNALVVGNSNYNQNLLKELANFSANSILVLSQLKIYRNDIVNIYPEFYYNNKIGEMELPNFREFFINNLLDKKVIPTEEQEYECANQLVYVKNSKLRDLFPAELLHNLGIKKKIAFPNATQSQTSIVTQIISDFKIQTIDNKDISDYINPNFMDNADSEWLKKFYEYIFEKNELFMKDFSKVKIFKTNDGKWSSFINEKNSIQIYKSNKNCNYLTLDKNYYSIELIKYLEDKLHLIEPDDIILLQEKLDNNLINEDDFFMDCYRLFLKYKNTSEANRLFELLSGINFIKDEKGQYHPANAIIACFTDNQKKRIVALRKYLNQKEEKYSILDGDYYKKLFGKEFNPKLFRDYLEFINIKFTNSIFECNFTGDIPEAFKNNHPDINFFSYRSLTSCIDYSPTLITLFLYLVNKNSDINEENSKLAIDCILDILEENPEANLDEYFYTLSSWGKFDGQYNLRNESLFLYMPFLLKKDGTYAAPEDRIKLSELSDIYNLSKISKNNLKKLLKFLLIRDDQTDEIIEDINQIGISEMKDLTDFILQRNIPIDSIMEFLKKNYPEKISEKITESNILSPNTNKELFKEKESEFAPEFSITSNNENTLSESDKIAAMQNATEIAIGQLQKLGYRIKSKEHINSGILIIENNDNEELFVQCKSSIKQKKIRLTSYDIDNIIKHKSRFRLFILLSDYPVKFSNLLSEEDIFQSNENLSITIFGIKDYSREQLYNIIPSLKYQKGFSLDIGNIIDDTETKEQGVGTDNLPISRTQDKEEMI